MTFQARMFSYFVAIIGCLPAIAFGQDAAKRSHAWTKDEALAELRLRPRDPYLQFVAAQLSEPQAPPAALNRQPPAVDALRATAANRNRAIDLFSIFSGSLAIQESLQLDALTQAGPASKVMPTIPLDKLPGPTVVSHPWGKMLAGRMPRVSGLADSIPADQLYIRFQSVGKLLHMREFANDYATYVSMQSLQQAYSTDLIERLQEQLAVEARDLLDPRIEAAIAEIALTSSDLFFNEGTDVTLIMRLSDAPLIRTTMDGFLQAAKARHPDDAIEESEILGVA